MLRWDETETVEASQRCSATVVLIDHSIQLLAMLFFVADRTKMECSFRGSQIMLATSNSLALEESETHCQPPTPDGQVNYENIGGTHLRRDQVSLDIIVSSWLAKWAGAATLLSRYGWRS